MSVQIYVKNRYLQTNSCKKVLAVLQQMRSKELCSLDGLLVLPFADEFGISAQKYIRDSPAVEFCRSCVDRWRYETILETVAQSRCLVADCSWDKAYDRVCENCGREFSATENIVSARDFSCNQMFADSVVDALVVTAEDDDVFVERKLVRDVLV